MALYIEMLKHVQVLHKDNLAYLPIDDVFSAFKKHHRSCEKDLRKDNFQQVYKDHVVTVNNIKYCKLSAVIQFSYNQRSKLTGCQILRKQIESRLCSKKIGAQEDSDTILAIYQKVAKFNFHKGEKLLTNCLKYFKVNSQHIPTLYDCHHGSFDNDEEWARICLFEWHYGLEHDHHLPLEEAKRTRWDYLDRLISAGGLASNILDGSKQTIARRKLRREVGNPDQIELYFSENAKHIPVVIETEVIGHIQETFPGFEGMVLILDCPKICRMQQHGAHVYIECETMLETDMSHISILVSSCMKSKHNLMCASLRFFQEGAFAQFREQDGKPCHFRIRDKVAEGQLDDKNIYNWQPDEIDHADTDITSTLCAASVKPL